MHPAEAAPAREEGAWVGGGLLPSPWDPLASPFRCQVSQQLKQHRALGRSQGQPLPAGPPAAPRGPVPSPCPGVAPLMFIALVSIGVAVLGFISVFLILPFCKVYIITKSQPLKQRKTKESH